MFAVSGVVFLSEAHRLAAINDDGSVILWDTETWSEVARIEKAAPLKVYDGIAMTVDQNSLLVHRRNFVKRLTAPTFAEIEAQEKARREPSFN